MKSKLIEAVVSFCLGVSLVFSFFISAFLFFYFFHFGFFISVLSSLFGFMFGLVFVAFFEGLSMLQDMLVEKKRQTVLMESMLAELKKENKTADAELSDN